MELDWKYILLLELYKYIWIRVKIWFRIYFDSHLRKDELWWKSVCLQLFGLFAMVVVVTHLYDSHRCH